MCSTPSDVVSQIAAKDAQLYDIQASAQEWDVKRTELESAVSSAENEARRLKRQLMEKTDTNESLTANNEELQSKVDELKNKLITVNAQHNAGQKTIINLKKEADDLKEEIQQQKKATIPPSTSAQLNMSMTGSEASADGRLRSENLGATPEGPAGRRAGGPDTLTPSNSQSFELQSPADRVKRSGRVEDLESKLAKSQEHAIRWKRKFNELRAKSGQKGEPDSSGAEESLDEDDEEHFVDVGTSSKKARSGMPRSSTHSRIVGSGRRFNSMARTLGIRGADRGSISSEDDLQPDEEVTPDNSMERSFNDESGSVGSSSARASLEGFDADFADPSKPEYGSAKKNTKRRSTYTPANFSAAKASPLSRQIDLEPDDHDVSSTHRPGSEIYEPNALGAELAALGDQEEQQEEDLLGPALEERDEMHRQAVADLEQKHAALLADAHSKHAVLLEERDASHAAALASRERGHANAMAESSGSHAAALADAEARHAAQAAEIEQRHAAAVTELEANHSRALGDVHERHRKALGVRDDGHEEAVAQLEQKHSEKLKAALADAVKLHESSTVEMRKRHAEDLAAKVAEGSAALAAAEALHKKMVSEAQAEGSAALERQARAHDRALHAKDREAKEQVLSLQASNSAALEKQSRAHDQALSLKDQEAQEQLVTLQAGHEEAMKQRDAAHNQAVSQRDVIIRAKEEEISQMRARLSLLENELATVKAKIDQSVKAHDEAREELAKAHASRQEVESKLAQATEAAAAATAAAAAAAAATAASAQADRSMANDADDEEFEDAVEAGQEMDVANRSVDVSDKGSDDEDETPGTPGDVVQEPSSTKAETLTEETAGIRKVVLADLRDTGCQTDDAVWDEYQRQRLFGPSTSADGEDTIQAGPGGILVLGSQKKPAVQLSATSLPNSINANPTRPRDSVSTFGGNRDGTSNASNRAESPAPTMYTVGAVTGPNGSRRSSVDSSLHPPAGEQGEVPPMPDRSKPPVMSVPPPPNMPPPPNLPTKQQRAAAAAAAAVEVAPPRPTSPPPADLVSRAQRTLQVPTPGAASGRSSQGLPPPSSYVPPNTISSSRARPGSSGSAANVRTRKGSDAPSVQSQRPPSSLSRRSTQQQRRAPSAQSFASDVTSDMSRPTSVASMYGLEGLDGHSKMAGATNSTDPAVIASITQTMIGEYLYKYTRRSMGRNGHSDKRHRRYFWVHPYTKTLYWTVTDPGSDQTSEGLSKSANIEDVSVVDDDNTSPPGLYHLSILVKTSARDIKLTASDRERHETWLRALEYLVNRSSLPQDQQNAGEEAGIGGRTEVDEMGVLRPPRQRAQTSSIRSRTFLSPNRSFVSSISGRARRGSAVSVESLDATPKPRAGASGGTYAASSMKSTSSAAAGKRRDTGAKEYLEQWEALRNANANVPTSPGSKVSMGSVGGASSIAPRPSSQQQRRGDLASQFFGRRDSRTADASVDEVYSPSNTAKKTAEQMLEEDEENGFEGLDNVRACCDGKHDVGSLAHKHHHHHHHRDHPRYSRRNSNHDSTVTRPRSSTGAWSKHRREASNEGNSMRPSSPPPQLGPLNLNSIDAATAPPKKDKGNNSSTDSHMSSARGKTSEDWFSAVEEGPGAGMGHNSYTERVQTIRSSSRR